MNIRQRILQTLEQKKGFSISGEQLAQALGVSRSAIWKTIATLRKEGYQIEAVTNRGYRLAEQNDLLSAEGIVPWLAKDYQGLPITVLKRVDSTNHAMRHAALEGASSGAVLLAEEQTDGRGRFSRSFWSPPGGLYMSILLRPQNRFDAVLLTTAAAVAVCRAVQSLTKLDLRIKWVNDLYLGKRKVCGILTEAATDMESRNVESAVIGIGLNVKFHDALPTELVDIAGALDEGNVSFVSRNRLAAEILNMFFSMLDGLEGRTF
ncbi:MAG: biotin--[acetyl-CoA-carboxylase] ligase, partial [Oscillospiraceae bacterium]